ncbi:MAG: amidohydrolase family protein [Propionicimonas sp.]
MSLRWRPGSPLPAGDHDHLTVVGARVLGPDGSFAAVDELRIRHGHFLAVAEDAAAATLVVDARGLWLTPGFVDAHTHLSWHDFDEAARGEQSEATRVERTAQACRRTLQAGITLARDAGGLDQRLGNALSAAGEPLPLVRRSIDIVGAPDACGERHLRGRVAELADAGAQWIKVAATPGVGAAGRHLEPVFTPVELAAIMSSAHRAGLPVMVHAWGGDPLTWALELGARSIEHAVFLTAAQARLAASVGAVVVPTVWIYRDVLALATAGVLPQRLAGAARLAVESHPAAIRECLAAGVGLALGTDAGMDHQHGANLREVAALIDLGVPPDVALTAATSGGATLLGQQDRGAIAPGYRADFVLFDRDPSLPEVLREPTAVVAVALAGHLVHLGRQAATVEG